MPRVVPSQVVDFITTLREPLERRQEKFIFCAPRTSSLGRRFNLKF